MLRPLALTIPAVTVDVRVKRITNCKYPLAYAGIIRVTHFYYGQVLAGNFYQGKVSIRVGTDHFCLEGTVVVQC
jgi:hypothetical protein